MCQPCLSHLNAGFSREPHCEVLAGSPVWQVRTRLQGRTRRSYETRPPPMSPNAPEMFAQAVYAAFLKAAGGDQPARLLLVPVPVAPPRWYVASLIVHGPPGSECKMGIADRCPDHTDLPQN